MTTLRFSKYEGLGNDFVVIEGDEGAVSPADAARLCDRHFGVGGDGVLLVAPPVSPGAVARMIVLNADGSRPEMCGNGLRCVAAYLGASRGAASSSFVVDTDAGPRGCEVDAGTGTVTIDMGVAVSAGPIDVHLLGHTVRLARVSMGNPHAITFEDLGHDALARFGPGLATHPAFPQGTNVELCRMRDDGGVDVLVWERGVGPTLACGTGACAVAAFAVSSGLAPFERELAVHLPGGPLFITVGRDLSVRMRGPARRVFTGEADV